MAACQVGKEKTFYIRKIQIEHTCPAIGENYKVPIKFGEKSIENALRTNPRTSTDTVIENTKDKYGVEVGPKKAYMARKLALKVVQGDQEAQYTRIRDYLQTVIDTNPGSRCIVSTRVVKENPS